MNRIYIYICHGYHIILGMHTCLYNKNPPAAPARSPAWRSVAAPPHWGPRRSPRTRKRSRAAPTSRRGAACPELCPRKLKDLSMFKDIKLENCKKHWDFIRFIVSRCFKGITIRIWPHFSNMITLARTTGDFTSKTTREDCDFIYHELGLRPAKMKS